MSRNRYVFLCALALAGAFAGGYTANLAVPVAHAQDRVYPGGPANLRSQSFTVVDQQGRVQGTLRGGNMGAELVLNDGAGNQRVEIGVEGITVRDGLGRVVWKSPKMGIVPATSE